MGSAPCLHLGTVRKPAGTIIVSPFTSIKNVFSDRLFFLGALVNNSYFNNIEKAKNINKSTGVLLIHGKKDTMISYKHSEEISNAIPTGVIQSKYFSESMTHNDFNIYQDLVRPIFEFFKLIDFSTTPNEKILLLELNRMYF